MTGHQQTFRTNLRCEACVAAIRPLLDQEPTIHSWYADVAHPEKLLTIHSTALTEDRLRELLRTKGYEVLGRVASKTASPELLSIGLPGSTRVPMETGPKQSYFPLLLILGYLLAATAALEVAQGTFHAMRAMNHFMAGFFLVFSFFKLLDVPAFAQAYRMYDLVAAHWPIYGVIYPFIELALGLAFLSGLAPILTNAVTLLVMGVSTIGVIRSIAAKKRIRCACLGTVFHLPMSYVTLTEDLLMVGMAGIMLVLLL